MNPYYLNLHLYFFKKIKYYEFAKNTIVRTIHILYNCRNKREHTFARKECLTMNKKQELIERIEKLTDAQFELLITLYSQQEQEFVPDVPVERPTFLQPSL